MFFLGPNISKDFCWHKRVGWSCYSEVHCTLQTIQTGAYLLRYD